MFRWYSSHFYSWRQNLNAVKLNPGKLSLHWLVSSPLSLIFVISGFKSVNSASKQLVSPSLLSFGTKGGFTFPCKWQKTGLKAKHSLAALEIPTCSSRSQLVFAKYGCCLTLTAPSPVPSLSFGSWNKVMAKKLDVTLTRKARIRALLSVENFWKGCGIELNINSPQYYVELR